jgi:quercetin dioxygenase-like cupin family protein
MVNLARCYLAAAMALSLSAVADDSKPQPQRAILERHDQSAVPDKGATHALHGQSREGCPGSTASRRTPAQKEIVIGKATLPAGTAIGFHVHPGDEVGYVLKGTAIWKTQGQPDRTLKAGDSFFNPRGAVHSVAATEAGEVTVISTWIVDKGKPLATPVP